MEVPSPPTDLTWGREALLLYGMDCAHSRSSEPPGGRTLVRVRAGVTLALTPSHIVAPSLYLKWSQVSDKSQVTSHKPQDALTPATTQSSSTAPWSRCAPQRPVGVNTSPPPRMVTPPCANTDGGGGGGLRTVTCFILPFLPPPCEYWESLFPGQEQRRWEDSGFFLWAGSANRSRGLRPCNMSHKAILAGTMGKASSLEAHLVRTRGKPTYYGYATFPREKVGSKISDMILVFSLHYFNLN